jgi:hypothetical protein
VVPSNWLHDERLRGWTLLPRLPSLSNLIAAPAEACHRLGACAGIVGTPRAHLTSPDAGCQSRVLVRLPRGTTQLARWE